MPRPESDQEESSRQKRHWHDHAIAWGAVAAALGAALAAVANGYQAYLTRQNNVISQRAFINFDGINLAMSIDPATNVRNVSIFTRLTNSGNTATKDLGFFIKCAPTVDPLAEPWVIFIREKVQKQAQIIGARQTFPAHCVFPLDHMRLVSQGRAHSYLLGEITYRDRLDESLPHVTQFSWELTDVTIIDPPASAPADTPPTANVSFQPRGAHNCADEDCPKY
jgi:hypothetical protein